MRTLSLKLSDAVFQQAEANLALLKMTRNAYFNAAVEQFNLTQKRALLEARLRAESAAVAASSMEVLRDLERLEELPADAQLVDNQRITKAPKKSKK